MWFNIVMNNHVSLSALESLRPLVKYVREVLSLCGHDVTVSWDQLSREAINLYFEYFPDKAGWSRRFHEWRRSHGIRIGVVATELMVNDTIPYARHGIAYYGSGNKIDDQAGGLQKARMDGFHAVLDEVDFVWAFLERTAAEYRGRIGTCEFFPVGCLEVVEPEKRRSPKDLDILFFGKATPHRTAVINRLEATGLQVVAVGADWPSGYCPPTLLESLLDRAKIGLNLTLHAADDAADGIDPRFASCIRVVEMLSREVLIVSETIPLDNPYRPFMCEADPDKLTEPCRFFLEENRWKVEAKARAEKFRTQMDAVTLCKPVVQRTLAALDRS